MTSRRAVILVLILAGVLLRVHQISYNFDGDELFSVQAASGSFPHLLAASLQDRTHPPLHLFLLFLWMKVGGSSETSARLLSVTASVFFLLLVFAIGRRWLKEPFAFFILALCSLSPFFVYFGQQARPYSIIALFAALTVFLFLKCNEEPSRKIWAIAYGVACAALMYSQYIGALLLLPQFAVGALSGSSKKRRMLLFGSIGLLSIFPWLFLLRNELLPGNGKLAQNIGWIPKPTWFSPVSFYVSLFGWLPQNGSSRVLLLVAVVIIGFLVLNFKRIDRRTLLLLVSLAAFQPSVVFLASVFGPISVWAPRQMIGAAIFVLFLVVLALDLFPRPVGISLTSILLVWCILGLPEAFPQHSKPPWRSLASLVRGKCEGCDVVGAEEWISLPLSHYTNAKVEDFPDYGSRMGQSDRIVFLCRPVRCDNLKRLSPLYTPVERSTITWSSSPPSDTEMIDLYLFKRATTIQDP